MPDPFRRIRNRRLPLLLAVLLVPLLGAAPAEAGPRDFRLGVVEDRLSDGDLRTIGDSGADVLRLNFSWRQTEVQRCAVYDWRRLDHIVMRAHQGGYRLLPIITDSPPYVAGNSQRAPETRRQGEIRPYGCFVRAAVERYGRGGDFVTPAGLRPITDWQVWNEPNLRAYSPTGNPDPREYARLLRITERIIHLGDPRATIVLAGMPEFVRGGLDIRDFLRRFYRVRRIEREFDVLAIHPFASNVAGVKDAMERLRSTLRSVGDRRRTVWVTETSWSTGGRKPSFIRESRRGQARNLRRVYKMLRANRRRFNLGTVTWFRWRDTDGPGNRNSFVYSGLYTHGGRPKPSCRAFANLAGGFCVPQIDDALPTSEEALGPDLSAGAAQIQQAPSE